MTCSRQALVDYCNTVLQPERFKDYGPNGLQVEGKTLVRRLVTGVTASLALIEEAVRLQADAVLVHHGLFWRGYDGRVTGWMRQRLGTLLAHDINLLAYHLPLDAHALWGNNVQLGLQLGLQVHSQFGEQMLGCLGQGIAGPWPSVQALAQHCEAVLQHAVVSIPSHQGPVERVAWCTGGAQSYFEAAIAAGAQVYITGEISEPQAHYARECGVAYLACGHHATERYGVQALGQHLAQQLGIEHVFVDIDNPA
ncbi:Nif3-like dinuclear metal center hexameric protein [Curvibacter sp. CHRR-16]|uniref:Nif3-like dinuclear metal center hexameric protein n=1 Tax=Curvibacter sp. CHRR-16 TaxID=2835872 RepID=UPI001BD95582|nr:Nif3-like dinuclear metal center hexameric protein [Curvibacter sp. CHRR-16]MBT0569411.1 Nif3-like dinuclear metal center hexameric protein [Curvibacter sp. CHRR-16]